MNIIGLTLLGVALSVPGAVLFLLVRRFVRRWL